MAIAAKEKGKKKEIKNTEAAVSLEQKKLVAWGWSFVLLRHLLCRKKNGVFILGHRLVMELVGLGKLELNFWFRSTVSMSWYVNTAVVQVDGLMSHKRCMHW